MSGPTGGPFNYSIVPWGEVEWKLFDQGNAVSTIKYMLEIGLDQ